jgi:hypothetical protein
MSHHQKNTKHVQTKNKVLTHPNYVRSLAQQKTNTQNNTIIFSMTEGWVTGTSLVEKDSKPAVRYIFIGGFGYQPSVLFLVAVS